MRRLSVAKARHMGGNKKLITAFQNKQIPLHPVNAWEQLNRKNLSSKKKRFLALKFLIHTKTFGHDSHISHTFQISRVSPNKFL